MDSNSLKNAKEQAEKFFFDLIEEKTNILKQTYEKLSKEFNNINFELDKKNKALEVSLIENENITITLNNILENISNGIIVIDTKGVITKVNSAACAITGLATHELLEKKYDDIFACFEKRDEKLTYAISNSQCRGNNEKIIKNKNGVSIPVWFHFCPLYDSQGNLSGCIETLTDLSQIKAMEEELIRRQTLASLGEMAATVAHEIRNPLGAISGFAGILQKLNKNNDEKSSVILDKLIRAIGALNKTVTNLLAYTRNISLMKSPVDANAFFEDIESFAVSEIGAAKSKIAFKLNHNFAKNEVAYFDKEKIQQVLINMTINAMQALSDVLDATIEITVTNFGDSIEIVVKDNAGTLDMKNEKKIFSPFFTTKESGTGLGLAICSKIIALHRGTISVEVEANKFTSFKISIPNIKSV